MIIKDDQCVFKLASDKLRKFCDNNTTLVLYNQRLFDQAQLPYLLVAEDMSVLCDKIPEFRDDSKALRDELHNIYIKHFQRLNCT